MRVLVTGATGFVGRALVPSLQQTENQLHLISRSSTPPSASRDVRATWFTDVDLCDPDSLPDQALAVDAVVHLAAHVHVMRADEDDRQTHEQVNHGATMTLAKRAAAAGVRRFVYLSSIKVNGERTHGAPFSADAVSAPADSYARSKQAAEAGLLALAESCEMEVVIIRPPLVYGPGVKANFAQLMRWVQRGIPLPLAGIKNQRSLVSVDNLCDLICCCLRHPAAANQVFLVSDGEAISSCELARRIARAMGKPGRTLYVPLWVLRSLAVSLGKQAIIDRLTEDLVVDITKTTALLGWHPPYTMAQVLNNWLCRDN